MNKPNTASAQQFLGNALGWNMNFGTLKPLAIAEIMVQYANSQRPEPKIEVSPYEMIKEALTCDVSEYISLMDEVAKNLESKGRSSEPLENIIQALWEVCRSKTDEV